MTAPKTLRLLSAEQLEERTGIPANTWKRWRRTGYGPPCYRIGKHVRYREAEVDAWVGEHLATTAA